MQPYNVRTTKKDLIERMKQIENRNQNPYNLTQKQLDELEVTKAQVAEHIKNIDFSSTAPIKEYPTQAEIRAAKVLDFATAVNDDKPRSKRWRNQR